MAPLTDFSPSSPRASCSQDDLSAAILAVLARWQMRTGPESSFHFVVRQEQEEDKVILLLLHEEKSSMGEPFVLAHFEIRNDKIWLVRNETETDFAEALLRQGVQRESIVLGFLSPAVRKDSDYYTGP